MCVWVFTFSVWTEAAKEEEEGEEEDDDDMGNFQSDDDDDGDDSDKDMGVDAEDGDEAESLKLQKLAARVGNTKIFIGGWKLYLHLTIIFTFDSSWTKYSATDWKLVLGFGQRIVALIKA